MKNQLAIDPVEQEIAHLMQLKLQRETEEEAMLTRATHIETLLSPLQVVNPAITFDTFVRFTQQVVADYFCGLPMDVRAEQYPHVTHAATPGTVTLTATTPQGTVVIILSLQVSPTRLVSALSDLYDNDTGDALGTLADEAVPLSVVLDPVQYADWITSLLPKQYHTFRLFERLASAAEVVGVDIE